jgi:anti-sigma B factor antagonist
MPLDFSIVNKPDYILVRLNGALTLGPQLARFGRQVGALLSAQKGGGLFLDLGGVTEVDSTGLGELVILYTTSGEAGCSLCLLQPNARVLKLLEMTKLSELFPHFSDEEAARKHLQKT